MDVRIPPHNLDAEKAVLGALLTNGSNSGAVVDTVTSILKSEDFYRDAHRIIYDAILEHALEALHSAEKEEEEQ